MLLNRSTLVNGSVNVGFSQWLDCMSPLTLEIESQIGFEELAPKM